MMLIRAENVRPENENIGLLDRVARLVIGGALLGVGLFYLALTPGMLTTAGVDHLLLFGIGISVYPILTAVLGVDPVYHHFGIRSGGDTGFNQCGSFPYQLKAALGRAPKYCEIDDERSLEACHDEPRERPHHKLWRVDQEPMLYPDDAAWAEFSARERRKARRS